MAVVDFYLLSASRRAHRLKPPKTYVFGREDGVDLVLQDALVSRRHAELRWAEEGNVRFWYVVDLNSRNGILVNGVRVTQPTRMDDGTVLQVGGQVFKMHLLPPGGDPAALGNEAPQISSLETMGPGMNLKDLATQGATYSGEVTSGVLELLQFFQMTGKTGRLDLIDPRANAPHSVWINGGNPVHAQMGNAKGIDALIAIAKQPPPKFAFHAEVSEAPARSIQGSAAGVFMEIARQLDEAKR
jgi:hypothetical protein